MSMPATFEDVPARATRSNLVERDRVLHSEAVPTQAALSWGSILAGAAAAATLSLLLLMLGAGLGLSAVSPWAQSGISAQALGVSAILWLTFSQLAAAGLGGYLAGRLRTRWVSVHSDEVYFRDTAHGFLAWSVAALVSAALLTSATWSVASSGIEAGATAAKGVAVGALAAGSAALAQSKDEAGGEGGVMGYFIDSLFRKGSNAAPTEETAAGSAASVAEVGRIFVHSVQTGTLPSDETQYIGRIIAQRTGLTQQEAEARVTQTFAKVKAALLEAKVAAQKTVDELRKASSFAALWMFVSLLIGAFIASLAATFGGYRRDIKSAQASPRMG